MCMKVFIKKVEKPIQEDHRFTVDELHETCSEECHTVQYETITDHLNFWKHYVHWVLKMLTNEHIGHWWKNSQPFNLFWLGCFKPSSS